MAMFNGGTCDICGKYHETQFQFLPCYAKAYFEHAETDVNSYIYKELNPKPKEVFVWPAEPLSLGDYVAKTPESRNAAEGYSLYEVVGIHKDRAWILSLDQHYYEQVYTNTLYHSNGKAILDER